MRTLLFLCLAFCVAAISGCGGSSSSSSSRVGSLTLKVKWPAKGRLIPYDSASIVAVLTNTSGASLGTQTIPRPAEGVLTTSVTFSNIASGVVLLTATAYPTAQGTGVPQALGKADSVVEADQNTSVTVTMADTVTAINILNAAGGAGGGTLQTGQTQQLTWQTVDAAGDTVLTSAATIDWYMNGGTAYGSTSSTGLVTMLASGKQAASFDVYVKETESGVTNLALFKFTPPTYNSPGRGIVDTTGTHVYTVEDEGVHVYDIAPTGQLSLAQEISAPGANTLDSLNEQALVLSPNGKELFVYADDTPAIDAYSVQSDGSLVASGSPIAAPGNAIALGVDPTSSYVYADGEGSSGAQLNIYAIGSSGSLSLSQAVTTFSPGLPRTVVQIPTTNLMFGTAADASANLYFLTMTVNPDGTLNLAHKQAVSTGATPPYVFSPSGNYLFAMGEFIHIIGIAASGAPTDDGYNTSLGGASDFFNGAVNPAGTILYVRDYANEYMTPCTIGSNGALTPLAQTATNLPADIDGSVIITPNGKFVYTTSQNDNSIYEYSVNSDGSLTPLSPAKVVG
jgi:6-phosphogluconolactonase (cycloisomerase 2 family)